MANFMQLFTHSVIKLLNLMTIFSRKLPIIFE
jgi:hypothetical protein